MSDNYLRPSFYVVFMVHNYDRGTFIGLFDNDIVGFFHRLLMAEYSDSVRLFVLILTGFSLSVSFFTTFMKVSRSRFAFGAGVHVLFVKNLRSMAFCMGLDWSFSGSVSWKCTLSLILRKSSSRPVRTEFISNGFGVGAKLIPLLSILSMCVSSMIDDKFITFVSWNS